MPIPLLAAEYHWVCPNCSTTHVTREVRPHTPYHPCRGLRGLNAPFIRDGLKAKVEAVERGDWVGSEVVQTDGDGRPVMAIQTTRDDGTDVAVLAPMARGSSRDD